MTYQSKPLYLLKPAFNTPEVQEAIDSFLPLWLDKHQLVEGSQLYHYTTLQGMQGILNDRALWCGHVSAFNDPLEIQYGRDIAISVLNDAMQQEEREDVRTFLRKLLVQVQAFGKNLFHAFVACFCESSELLSQWRAYADRGGGYCLVFHFSSTTMITSNSEKLDEGKPPVFRKVIYDEEQQRELIQQYVNCVIVGTKRSFDKKIPDKSYQAAVMALQAANAILDMLIFFKHKAFKEEKEWRLIRVTAENHQPENLRFRKFEGGLVPYRPTHIFDVREAGKSRFPLISITFGPSLESGRTHSTIELLLHHIAADSHPIKLPTELQIKGAGYRLRGYQRKAEQPANSIS